MQLHQQSKKQYLLMMENNNTMKHQLLDLNLCNMLHFVQKCIHINIHLIKALSVQM